MLQLLKAYLVVAAVDLDNPNKVIHGLLIDYIMLLVTTMIILTKNLYSLLKASASKSFFDCLFKCESW